MKEKIIHEFQKNKVEKVVFSVGEFEGEYIYHIRIYALSRFGGEEKYIPTKKGLAFRIDHLPDFFLGVVALKDEVQKLLDDLK